MSRFDGWPDFGMPIDEGPTAMFAAFGDSSGAVVFPDQLDVSTLPDGRPDFLLSLNRPALPTAATPPWGALRLRVTPRFPLEQALRAVRARMPQARVGPAPASGGFVRLVAAGDGVELPAELLTPRPLSSSGGDRIPLMLSRLSASTVSLLKGALLDSALLVWARLEVDVPGVAPRLPLRASFDPRSIVNSLFAAGSAARQIEWDNLVASLFHPPAALPITFEGPIDSTDVRELADTLAYRLRSAFGRLVPSASGDRPTIEFADSATLPERVQWDLNEEVEARRPWALQLDPLMAARDLAARSGLSDLIEEYTAPVLPLGTWGIFVAANLPSRREGVAAIGVTLRAPAVPPQRMQDIVKSIEFHAPADQGRLTLQLASREPLAFLASPYVVVLTGNNIMRLDAEPQARSDDLVELGPDDFPVVFVPISARAELLMEARVAGRLAYTTADGIGVDVAFNLSANEPATALPLPRTASGAALYVTATPIDGSGPLAIGPLPAAPLEVGPWTFPEYGPHRITISASFPDDAGAVAIDLLPEGATESRDTITTIRLTPAQPRRDWQWFAGSPFHSGYRYRRFAAAGPSNPWSEVQMASKPLTLVATTDEDAMRHFDLEGTHFYVDAHLPSTLRYLPPAPVPARSPDGHPLVSMFDLGGGVSILQLSVRFDLEDADQDRLRVELATDHLDVAAATFQPAPIQVDEVSVRLAANESDPPAVLATSGASGFPPWDAIFSIRLGGDQAARAARALAGTPGLLSVRVHAKVPPEVARTLVGRPAAIERVADVAAWVTPATIG